MKTQCILIYAAGANSGIGYETALLVSSIADTQVIVSARSLEKAQAATETLKAANPTGWFSPLVLDITDQASVTAAYETVSRDFGQLDVLINNAGIISHASNLVDNLRETFETNTFGPAVMTDTFKPLLLKSNNARLIYVTSGLGSITARSDPKDPYYMLPANSYRMSKAALNMLAACHNVELGPQGVKVWTYCPGYVVTNLSGTGEKGKQERVERGAKSPVESAEGLLALVSGKRDGDVGKFVNKEGFLTW